MKSTISLKNVQTILPLETYKALMNKAIDRQTSIRSEARKAIENYINGGEKY